LLLFSFQFANLVVEFPRLLFHRTQLLLMHRVFVQEALIFRNSGRLARRFLG
jgi:hypothetical protein